MLKHKKKKKHTLRPKFQNLNLNLKEIKTFKGIYNNFCKEFFKNINYNDIQKFRELRKKCVQEYVAGDWSDAEKDKFLLLAKDCDRAIKGEWGRIKTMTEIDPHNPIG